MPILRIKIDDADTEFKIMPINKIIYLSLSKRYSDKDGFIDRPGFLSHVVKEPKMSKNDWGKVPVSMITKIMRSIDYYIDSIFYKEKELRTLYMQINVYEDEIDDLFRYLSDDSDDWAWNRVNRLKDIVEELDNKKENIERSLDLLKDDLVIFEEGKEIEYDIQSVQLED